MYPDPAVAQLIAERFVPVRVHVKNDAAEFRRLSGLLNAQWTPTTVIVDPPATERHRIEGFLPAPDFLSQLELGLAKALFARGAFSDAERAFSRVMANYSANDVAPEAQYWAGVARYKATGDPTALADTARQFTERYTDSSWAKKAAVWK